jgi:hypothetical protein
MLAGDDGLATTSLRRARYGAFLDHLQALLRRRNVFLKFYVTAFTLLGESLGVSRQPRSAERTSFCTLRIALIRRWRERSVRFRRPISSAIRVARATLREAQELLFLATRDLLSVRSI